MVDHGVVVPRGGGDEGEITVTADHLALLNTEGRLQAGGEELLLVRVDHTEVLS